MLNKALGSDQRQVLMAGQTGKKVIGEEKGERVIREGINEDKNSHNCEVI